MGENAGKRLAAAEHAVLRQRPSGCGQVGESEADHMDWHEGRFATLLNADPQLEADTEAGAALNSDKAERVLADVFPWPAVNDEGEACLIDGRTIADVLAALREGLADHD